MITGAKNSTGFQILVQSFNISILLYLLNVVPTLNVDVLRGVLLVSTLCSLPAPLLLALLRHVSLSLP